MLKMTCLAFCFVSDSKPNFCFLKGSLIYTSLVKNTQFTGPDSLVVRSSASGAVDMGSRPGRAILKALKNGTSSSLADARIKG